MSVGSDGTEQADRPNIRAKALMETVILAAARTGHLNKFNELTLK